MTTLIRIIQLLLVLAALNGAYGLALLLGLSTAYGNEKPSLWNILGSLVSISAYCIVIFLLQRYYEQRTGHQATALSSRRYFGIALTGVSIAALIGLAIVIMIIFYAFARLAG